MEDSFDVINIRPKPLAAYLFTNNKKLKEDFVRNVSAGALLTNDTTMHVKSSSLTQYHHNSLSIYVSHTHPRDLNHANELDCAARGPRFTIWWSW